MSWRLQGFYFLPDSSRAIAAVASVDRKGLVDFSDQNGGHLNAAKIGDITISKRSGSAPRQLILADRSLFETSDNDTVDDLQRKLKLAGSGRWLHRLERLSKLTVITLITTIFAVWALLAIGVPFAAKQVAFSIPDDMRLDLTERLAADFDIDLLPDARLEAYRAEQVELAFTKIRIYLGATSGEYKLYVKRGGRTIGPYAGTLPDGRILITEELIYLTTHPDQILGILAHEVAHAEQRHYLRTLLEQSTLAVGSAFITGDLSRMSERLVMQPQPLLDLAYSRRFENESDIRALEIMKGVGADLSQYPRMLLILSSIDCNLEKRLNEQCGKTNSWLETHPQPRERMVSTKRLISKMDETGPSE